MNPFIVGKAIEAIIDRVAKNKKSSTVGAVTAVAGATACTQLDINTLEGQVTAVVTAVISLACFLMKDRIKNKP